MNYKPAIDWSDEKQNVQAIFLPPQQFKVVERVVQWWGIINRANRELTELIEKFNNDPRATSCRGQVIIPVMTWHQPRCMGCPHGPKWVHCIHGKQTKKWRRTPFGKITESKLKKLRYVDYFEILTEYDLRFKELTMDKESAYRTLKEFFMSMSGTSSLYKKYLDKLPSITSVRLDPISEADPCQP